MQVTVYHVNAFTADSTGGNPAGVVLNAGDLDEARMLAIAKYVGFSETAFVSDDNEATKRLRFFTPTEEVDLCGHATIASWSLMYQQQLIAAGISIQDTLAGLLHVNVQTDGLIYMEQAGAIFYETIMPVSIAPLLGIKETDIDKALEPQVVSTGLKDLIVVLNDETVLNTLKPDFEAIAKFSKDHDVTGIHVAVLHKEQGILASARNFAPLVGIDEESATGTSNGALLCYLRKFNVLPSQDQYLIKQGEAMGQTSHIYGKFDAETVWIGGKAALVSKIETSA